MSQETKKKITIHDIKNALLDERFRQTLPESFNDDVRKFLQNPGCGCNHPLYIKLMKEAKNEVSAYFRDSKILPTDDELNKKEKLAPNEWQVINCSILELHERLKSLGPGRKQLEIARFEDQVTVVVNHLEGVM